MHGLAILLSGLWEHRPGLDLLGLLVSLTPLTSVETHRPRPTVASVNTGDKDGSDSGCQGCGGQMSEGS